MEKNTISGLLTADQETVKNTLLAGNTHDHDIRQSVSLLEDELGRVLLKYNASSTGDVLSQTVSECMMAAARDQLGLLRCIEVKQEVKNRPRLEQRGITALLLGIILFLGGLLLADNFSPAGYICIAFSLCFAYLSGRVWHKQKEISVSASVNPELLWGTLKRTAETMDRKMEEFQAKEREHENELSHRQTSVDDTAAPTHEELAMYGDLLEALCSGNGEFALRQLEKIPPYLKRHGITPVEYSGENSDLFELLPTKRKRMTLRPALVSGEKLLAAGRATEQDQASNRPQE